MRSVTLLLRPTGCYLITGWDNTRTMNAERETLGVLYYNTGTRRPRGWWIRPSYYGAFKFDAEQTIYDSPHDALAGDGYSYTDENGQPIPIEIPTLPRRSKRRTIGG